MTRTVTTRPLNLGATIQTPGTVSMDADLSSLLGEERVALSAAGQWLHGAVALGDRIKGAVTLTAYDDTSMPIGAWTGTIDDTGALSLTAEKGTSLTAAATPAVDGDDGVVLPLEWTGADTDRVVAATLEVVTVGTADVCAGDVCESVDAPVISTFEVDLDAYESLWTAETTLTGPIEATLTARDANHKKIERSKVRLADNGPALEDDPATWVALGAYADETVLTVVSAGWSEDDVIERVDVSALVDGEAGVQRQVFGSTAAWEPALDARFAGDDVTFTITLDGASFVAANQSRFTGADLAAPVCGPSWCVALAADSATALDVWAYGEADALLPVSVEVGLTATVGKESWSDAVLITLSDEHIFTAALGVSAWGDVINAPLSGKIKLLGPADARGRAETLVAGKAHGVVVFDAEDGWVLGAASKSGLPEADRGVLLGTDAPEVLHKAGPPVLCGGYEGLCRTNTARAYSAAGI